MEDQNIGNTDPSAATSSSFQKGSSTPSKVLAKEAMGNDNDSYVYSVGSIGGRNNETRYNAPSSKVKPWKMGKPSKQGGIDNSNGMVQGQPQQQQLDGSGCKQGPFPQGPGAVSYAFSYTPYPQYGYQYPPPPYYGGCPPQMASGGYYGGGYHQVQGYPGAFAPHHGGYGMSHNYMNMGMPAGATAPGAPVYGHGQQEAVRNHGGGAAAAAVCGQGQGQQQEDTTKYAHGHNHTNMGAAAATATVYGQGQPDSGKNGELKHDGQAQVAIQA